MVALGGTVACPTCGDGLPDPGRNYGESLAAVVCGCGDTVWLEWDGADWRLESC